MPSRQVELLSRLQNLEGADQILIDRHHRTRIIELSAVVGSGKDGYQLALRKKLVAVLNNLMCPAD